MQEKSDQQGNKNIEQLRLENLKLKQLLKENSIHFEDSATDTYSFETNSFQKARSISKEAYWLYTFETTKLESSKEAYTILEIPFSDELTSEKIVARIHPENRKSFIATMSKKLEFENIFSIDTRIVVPDGSIKYVSVKVITERDKANKLVTISGTITDNTENQFYIDKLKGNEELFRSLFNNLTDIFIIFEVVKDNDENIVDYIYKDVNPTFEMKMGMAKAEVIEKKLSARPGIFQQLNPIFQLSLIAQQPQQDRIYFQILDSFFDILIYSPSENKLATIWRDVTLMVEAESSLRESEEKYRQIFSIGSDSLFMFDFFSGRILDVNPTGCKLFGYSKDSLLKMIFKQLSATPEKIDAQIQEQKNLLHDCLAVKNDKSEFPVEISLSYFNWSGRKVSVASVRDISERIVAQEKLIKSEQKFKQLFDYSNDAILIIKNYRIIDFNQKSISLFNLTPEDLLNKTLWNLSPSKQAGGEESRNRAVEFIQNSLLGTQLQFEWVFQQPNRSLFTADIKLSPIIVGSEKVVQAIVRDISPQKETQKALVMKEELWKASLQISSIGVWEWNIITKQVYFSTVWKDMLGFEKNELPDKIEELYTRVHSDDLMPLKKAFDDCLSSKTNQFLFDFRLRCKNGTYKWIHSQGKIYSYNEIGKPERFIGTHIDITKQKVVEEKLNHEIHDLSFSNNISQLGFWTLDLRTMVITGSKNTFSILGFNDTEQISLRQIEKIIHPEDQQTFISQFVNQTTQSTLENVFRIMVNNSTKYIISRSRPIKNQKNILTGFKGTFQEITSIKQDTVKLIDENSFFSNIAENIQYSIQVIKENTVLFSNAKTSELTGYSHKDIISKNISPYTFLVPEDRIHVKKMVDSILLNPTQPLKSEFRIETKNSRIKWVELTISSVEIKDGIGILFQMSDISTSKKIESELSMSEKQFKSIVSGSSSSIVLVNTEGQFIFSNESFQVISGYSPSEIKTKTFESLFNENDYSVISKGIETITLSISKYFTIEFNQFGNNKAWVRLTIIPAKSSKNEIEYFIVYCDNIDSEKKKTMKLEEENLIGKTIIDNSTSGYAIFNSKLELISCNNRFSDDFKLHSKTKPKILFSEIDKLAVYQNQVTRNELNENAPLTIEINSSQEEQLQVEFIPVTIKNEKSILLYTTDITKLRLKTDSLSYELERFKGIYENAPMGILLVDKNRNIIISNTKFEKYFDYSTNELSFIKIDTLIDTQYLGECISKFSQLFAGISNSFQQLLKMNTKNGESRWINSNAASVKDNFGDSKYAIFIIEDITHLKNEEQEMLSNERLQTLNFIANNFAHEFNNLLMGIYGNSYLLNNYLKDTPLSRYTTDLIQSSNRASDLTHKLLSFSEKKNNLNIVFSSDELINEIINSLKLNEFIKFSKTINIKNESLIGDPYQLKRAIQYIIENAVESMPKEGNLSIETNVVYFENKDNENNTTHEKGKYLRVIISDTGIGIAKNDFHKIFDPFYSTKPEGLNTGLGLSIAKQIITSHHGIIKVFSTKNEGTNVNIYLPVKETNKTITANQPDERLIVRGSAKILLVDDEEVVRLITSELLSELGYDVYSFASGKKALAFYKDNFATIDLVLLDKHMPEMDGIEVYNNLKKINQFVKAIILTGYNIDNEIGKMLEENLSGYIQKPVSIEKLSRSISDVLFNRN